MPKHRHRYTIVGRNGGITISRTMLKIGRHTKTEVSEEAKKWLSQEFGKFGITGFEVLIRKWTRGHSKRTLKIALAGAIKREKRARDDALLIEQEIAHRFPEEG